MTSIFLFAAMLLPTSASACPGKDSPAEVSERDEQAPIEAEPTRAAKRAELVGTSCSYSTGMMAQRVHADGEDLELTVKLERTEETLPSKVAAPFTADGEYHVIANELLDTLNPEQTYAFTAKTLEVDGVKYLLVTGYQAST